MKTKLYTAALVLTFTSFLASLISGLFFQNAAASLILLAAFVVLSFVVCVFSDDGNKFL